MVANSYTAEQWLELATKQLNCLYTLFKDSGWQPDSSLLHGLSIATSQINEAVQLMRDGPACTNCLCPHCCKDGGCMRARLTGPDGSLLEEWKQIAERYAEGAARMVSAVREAATLGVGSTEFYEVTRNVLWLREAIEQRYDSAYALKGPPPEWEPARDATPQSSSTEGKHG